MNVLLFISLGTVLNLNHWKFIGTTHGLVSLVNDKYRLGNTDFSALVVDNGIVKLNLSYNWRNCGYAYSGSQSPVCS